MEPLEKICPYLQKQGCAFETVQFVRECIQSHERKEKMKAKKVCVKDIKDSSKIIKDLRDIIMPQCSEPGDEYLTKSAMLHLSKILLYILEAQQEQIDELSKRMK